MYGGVVVGFDGQHVIGYPSCLTMLQPYIYTFVHSRPHIHLHPHPNKHSNTPTPTHTPLKSPQPRGLAHALHWKGPLGQVFERFGAVKATPRSMFTLMQDNQQVLLFPGGAREVLLCDG